MADRHAVSLQYTQMTDQWLQTSSVARGTDHSMGLKASAINQQHVCAVKTLHFGDHGCTSAFERCNKAVVDGWISAAVQIASVWALGSVWDSEGAEVSEHHPLRYREGAVGELDW